MIITEPPLRSDSNSNANTKTSFLEICIFTILGIEKGSLKIKICQLITCTSKYDCLITIDYMRCHLIAACLRPFPRCRLVVGQCFPKTNTSSHAN